MSKKALGCIAIIAIVVGIFFITIIGLITLGKKSQINVDNVQLKESIIQPASSQYDYLNGKIVVLNITGVITNSETDSLFSERNFYVDRLKKTIKKIYKNNKIKAVVLRVISPGGSITACDMLHHEIEKLKKKKKVVVFMESIAASGGYYISAPADYIIASPTTITGSIGVITQTVTMPKLLEKINIKPEVFKSGEKKDILSPYRDISEDERQIMQSIINKMFDKFVEVVSKGRKISPNTVKSIIGDGRVILADEAKKLKLIDSVGYIESAYNKAAELAGIPGAPVYELKNQLNFFDMLKIRTEDIMIKQNASFNNKSIKLDINGSLNKNLELGVFYFLPYFYQ